MCSYSEIANKVLSSERFQSLQSVLAEMIQQKADIVFCDIVERLEALFTENCELEGALKREAQEYILPSIAIFATVRAQYTSEIALAVFRKVYYKSARAINEMFRKEANSIAFVQAFPHGMMPKVEGESGGFVYRSISDNEEGCEFHVLRCPYVEFSKRYDCEELAVAFCECDDVMFSSIHPDLVWARDKTIARGDRLCNFKFELKSR